MNFEPVATINPSGIANPVPINAVDMTPAIQALMNATRTGAITFDQINSHFEQGAKQSADMDKRVTDTIQDRANRDLIAPIAAAKKKILEAEDLIRPLQTENTAAKLRADTAITPIQSANSAKKLAAEGRGLDFGAGLEKDTQDAELTKRYVDQVRRKLVTSAADSDPTGKNLSIFDAYVATGRPPIFSAGNQLDFDAMGKQVSQGVSANAALEKAAIDAGVNLYDASGVKKSAQVLSSEVSARVANPIPHPLTAEQRNTEMNNLGLAEQTLKQLKDARSALFETDANGNIVRDAAGVAKVRDPNTVGPWSGSALGRGLSRLTAAAGDGTMTTQRKLAMVTADLIREKTAALKGSLSEKELAFLKSSVPEPTDLEPVWDAYLRDATAILEKGISNRKAMLKTAPVGESTPTTPEAPVTPPPAGAIPNTDPRYKDLSSRAIPVTTEQDYVKAPSGTPMWFEGHLIVK